MAQITPQVYTTTIIYYYTIIYYHIVNIIHYKVSCGSSCFLSSTRSKDSCATSTRANDTAVMTVTTK